MQTLRKAGIHVVALHNHMIGEDPAFYFTHYWGTGPAEDLARGIRWALDVQASERRPRSDWVWDPDKKSYEQGDDRVRLRLRHSRSGFK